MASEDLIELTAQIVESHVSGNRINAADVPALIQGVHAALAGLGKPTPQPEAPPQEPAVTVRASVKPDAITCLDCGSKQKMLKRHLNSAHDLTPAEYRTKWKLPSDYPLVASNYAAKRSELALKNGLGRKGTGKRPGGRKPKS